MSVASAEGSLRILDGVALQVWPGSAVGVVGESGSGKSLLALAMMDLLPPGATRDKGRILVAGRDVAELSENEKCAMRGGVVGMMFQEPVAAMDPVYTIGAHLIEAIVLHHDVSKREAAEQAKAWLKRVGLSHAEDLMGGYPHELSGGMRQRVMLAIALAAKPRLLLADEPTTMLDRTLEAQILELVAELRKEEDLSVLFVSHDLAVVAEVTDRVVVMYAGQVVESGKTEQVLTAPAHPYTEGLLQSIRTPGQRAPRKRGVPTEPLPVLAGSPPVFTDLPPGCRFAPRCPKKLDRCESEPVGLFPRDGGEVRCLLHEPDLHG